MAVFQLRTLQLSIKQTFNLKLLTKCYMVRGLTTTVLPGVEIEGEIKPEYAGILTTDALKFVADIHRAFEPTRQELLTARVQRQAKIDKGEDLVFAKGDHDDKWRVAVVPDEIQCRHCEITGPVDRKMIINALNSGANVFMADFEDSCSPTFSNLLDGQVNLKAANEGVIEFVNADGSVRKLKDNIAQLFVRTRGWHLDEKHVKVDGKYIAGGLFDFGLYFYHNIQQRLANNSSTYFYLPKMEHHLECRLWNDVFEYAEEYMKTPAGKIRATVMVETLPAAFEMEEMLYELRNYACGMNAGRWDYIFSAIKVLKTRSDCIMPDRKQVTMLVPFMHAYAERLVKICHKHGAHAMGGMSAFIPSRRDEEVNKNAIEQVLTDKEREVSEGYDGTWVAHPDLVKLAQDTFVKGLGGRANQVEKQRDDVNFTEKDFSNITVEGGKVTEEGVRINISIALQYLNCWLQGLGAVAINNLMEDAATAEISRAQLWQWIHHKTKLADSRTFTEEMFKTILAEELVKLGGADKQAFGEAARIVDELVLSDDFADFLTLPAYDCLISTIGK